MDEAYAVYHEGERYNNKLYFKRAYASSSIKRMVTRSPHYYKFENFEIRVFEETTRKHKFTEYWKMGHKDMRLNEMTLGTEAWITYKDGSQWDGPHRRLSTNKANLTKHIKYGYDVDLDIVDEMVIKKHIVIKDKDGYCLQKVDGEDYKLSTKDKKKYTLMKIGEMF